MEWQELASKESVEKTISALKSHGMEAEVVKTGAEAKERLISMINEGSDVLEVSSTTLDQIGATEEINSGRYVSVRKLTGQVNDEKERFVFRRKNTGASFAIGSVQAVTEEGELVIASASGSNIPSYAFTAEKVLLVAGTQKIVKDIGAAMKRIDEYALGRESERMRSLGFRGSRVNMLLVIKNQFVGSRIRVIFVEEPLGF